MNLTEGYADRARPTPDLDQANGEITLNVQTHPATLHVSPHSRRIAIGGLPHFGDGRTPGNTHLPSKYMKTTKATTTSAQASNGEWSRSSIKFSQSTKYAPPGAYGKSINRRVGHLSYPRAQTR
jgi:hypothetical protein